MQNSIPTPKIDPGQIGNPIQLLAAVLSAMAVLVVSFLTAASIIQEPVWALSVLLVTAVVNVPLFGGVLFLLLTKFRHVLLADEHYLRWLDLSRRRFRGFRPHIEGGTTDFESEETTDRPLPHLETMRRGRYEANQGVFVTYDWRPSQDPDQIADIVVRLQQHVSNEGLTGPLERDEIDSVEYYLGPRFAGGRAFVRHNAADGYRLDISAYSPMLCIVRVNVKGSSDPIHLEHYLAFGD